jgi:hypothetical protein
MNVYRSCKAARTAVYCLQHAASMHTARAAEGGIWDAVQRVFGVSEEKIMRRNAYKYAENSARAGLAEQLSNNRASLVPKVSASEDLNSDLVGGETMTDDMTAYRSWKIENAGVLADREELERKLGK